MADFGDFHLYNIDKLLYYFRINDKYLEDYVDSIFQITREINNWVNLTGRELIIDKKMFRFKYADLSKKVRVY